MTQCWALLAVVHLSVYLAAAQHHRKGRWTRRGFAHSPAPCTRYISVIFHRSRCQRHGKQLLHTCDDLHPRLKDINLRKWKQTFLIVQSWFASVCVRV